MQAFGYETTEVRRNRCFVHKVVWYLFLQDLSFEPQHMPFLTIMEQLSEPEAGFGSLTEAIDTTTPGGNDDDADGRGKDAYVSAVPN